MRNTEARAASLARAISAKREPMVGRRLLRDSKEFETGTEPTEGGFSQGLVPLRGKDVRHQRE